MPPPVIKPRELYYDPRGYGAILNGIADDGPALQATINAALNGAGGGTIFIPGSMRIVTPVIATATQDSPLRFIGAGARSQIIVAVGAVNDCITITGAQKVSFRDLVFRAVHPTVGVDCRRALSLTTCLSSEIIDCQFYGIECDPTNVLSSLIRFNTSYSVLDRVDVLGCSAGMGAGISMIVFENWNGVYGRNCQFRDYGEFQNVYYSKTPNNGALAWIDVRDPSNELITASTNNTVVVENCVMDEGAFMGVRVYPGSSPEPRVSRVILRDLNVNVGGVGGAIGLECRRVDNVDIDNCFFGYHTNTPKRGVQLYEVTRATIRRSILAQQVDELWFESSCGDIYLDDVVASVITYSAPTRVHSVSGGNRVFAGDLELKEDLRLTGLGASGQFVRVDAAGLLRLENITLPASTLMTGLEFHLKLDEETGTREDAQASEDFSMNGAVGRDIGRVGYAASFNGNTNNYLSRVSNVINNKSGSDDFTYGVWFKPNANGTFGIISKDSPGARGYALVSDSSQLRLWMFNGSGNIIIVSGPAIVPGSWHRVLFGQDVAGNRLFMKVNNSATIYQTRGAIVPVGNSNPVEIGRWFGNTINGLIDEVDLWSRLLTTDEETEHYANGLGRLFPYTTP